MEETMELEALRYPVGRFEPKPALTDAERTEAIRVIQDAPARMREAVRGLDDAQLDTPYRKDGWTVRQVVHHVPDSHLNGYIRMKWALTEDVPTLKPYDQPSWGELPDSRTAPVEISLDLLDAVHRRWMEVIRSLGPEELRRRILHPEGMELTVDTLLQLYAWHSLHHIAHITELRERERW